MIPGALKKEDNKTNAAVKEKKSVGFSEQSEEFAFKKNSEPKDSTKANTSNLQQNAREDVLNVLKDIIRKNPELLFVQYQSDNEEKLERNKIRFAVRKALGLPKESKLIPLLDVPKFLANWQEIAVNQSKALRSQEAPVALPEELQFIKEAVISREATQHIKSSFKRSLPKTEQELLTTVRTKLLQGLKQNVKRDKLDAHMKAQGESILRVAREAELNNKEAFIYAGQGTEIYKKESREFVVAAVNTARTVEDEQQDISSGKFDHLILAAYAKAYPKSHLNATAIPITIAEPIKESSGFFAGLSKLLNSVKSFFMGGEGVRLSKNAALNQNENMGNVDVRHAFSVYEVDADNIMADVAAASVMTKEEFHALSKGGSVPKAHHASHASHADNVNMLLHATKVELEHATHISDEDIEKTEGVIIKISPAVASANHIETIAKAEPVSESEAVRISAHT